MVNADALLHDLIHTTDNPFQIAQRHGLSIDDLLAFFESDDVRRRLARLAALADARALLAAKTHRPAAVERLAALVFTNALSPAEARRALATLLRAAGPVPKNTKADAASGDDDAEAPSAAPDDIDAGPAPDETSRRAKAQPATRAPSRTQAPQPSQSTQTDAPPRPDARSAQRHPRANDARNAAASDAVRYPSPSASPAGIPAANADWNAARSFASTAPSPLASAGHPGGIISPPVLMHGRSIA